MTATPPVSPTSPEPAAPAPGFRFNIRVVLLLLLLAAFISAAVIAADHFSPRHRAGASPKDVPP